MWLLGLCSVDSLGRKCSDASSQLQGSPASAGGRHRPVPPEVTAHLHRPADLRSSRKDSSVVFSGTEHDVLSRAPLYKFHFPTRMRGRVQGDPWLAPQHLLLQFNDVVAEVSHH